MTQGGSPFDCEICTDRDREGRNCSNHLGLTEEALSVREYTEEIKGEIREKGARKVFGLGDIRLYECPLSHIADETFDVIKLCFLISETRALFFEGGWADQPCWLVEAYRIYKTELSKAMERKAE